MAPERMPQAAISSTSATDACVDEKSHGPRLRSPAGSMPSSAARARPRPRPRRRRASSTSRARRPSPRRPAAPTRRRAAAARRAARAGCGAAARRRRCAPARGGPRSPTSASRSGRPATIGSASSGSLAGEVEHGAGGVAVAEGELARPPPRRRPSGASRSSGAASIPSGISAVRQGASRPSRSTSRSTVCFAIRRQVVSLPPVIVSIPEEVS